MSDEAIEAAREAVPWEDEPSPAEDQAIAVAVRAAYPVIRREVAREITEALRTFGARIPDGYGFWTTQAADWIDKEFGGANDE